MISYLKLALKVLARRKFFTFISLFGISMTLVVLMVATAIVDNLFGVRAPENRFDRVLQVLQVTQRGPESTWGSDPGFAFLEKYMKPLHGIERASIFSDSQMTAVYRGGGKIETILKRTDGAYWQIVDFRFLEGRPYTESENQAGAFAAVITEQMREKLFGGAQAVGRTFELEGQTFRVIGVVPHASIVRLISYADVWVPIGTLPSSAYRHEMMGGFNGIVLARSRADFPRLKREFQAGLRGFQFTDPKLYNHIEAGLDTPFEAFARAVTENHLGDRAVFVVAAVFAALAVLFMALPAMNLVTLSLSRIMERSSEIGVRKAFGAPRLTVVRQLLLENVILTLIGGVCGFLLSIAALAVINRSGIVPNIELDVNLRVFACGMAIAAFFGIFSGVYPAWRMSRLDAVKALRGGDL